MEDDAPGEESAPLSGEENLAIRIKLERESRGWGTNAVSDRLNAAGYEMNPSAVWRIENRKRRVNLDEAIGFAEIFGLSLENLVGPPKLAAHARAMELVEYVRRAYREVHRANLAFTQARDALDAYLQQHPDIRDEVDAAVSHAIAEETTRLPQPHELHHPGTPPGGDDPRPEPGT
ncbi:helix-turn-helix transcriptional regulator [Streptomyces sp. B1866]|uniref:helix-turn-helix domain-containing protein n=1 Tax=Streptomyces sp. B1866 TaxID=3075431 RepID=UPI00289248C1|nr:helix-turn-helix transcriptional regulator [Streptomyces sp. B1866]MDT3395803.1 helix-turn-helix transcriptional regulator [Streptomyces sp. B1866]